MARTTETPKRRGRPKGSKNRPKAEAVEQMSLSDYLLTMADLRQEQASVNARKSEARRAMGEDERRQAAKFVEGLSARVDAEKITRESAAAVVNHISAMATDLGWIRHSIVDDESDEDEAPWAIVATEQPANMLPS